MGAERGRGGGGGGAPGGFWVANSMKWGCGLMVSCSSGTNSCLLSSSNLQQQQPCMLSKIDKVSNAVIIKKYKVKR